MKFFSKYQYSRHFVKTTFELPVTSQGVWTSFLLVLSPTFPREFITVKWTKQPNIINNFDHCWFIMHIFAWHSLINVYTSIMDILILNPFPEGKYTLPSYFSMLSIPKSFLRTSKQECYFWSSNYDTLSGINVLAYHAFILHQGTKST